MDASGKPTAAAPRHTWAFATAFLCLAMPASAGVAAYWAGPAAGAVAAAAFVLPLLYAMPRGRALWAGHRNWLLATQALLTYLPFAVFGGDWVAGLPGLLGGLLLLTVAAPVSWLLFGFALAAEGVLRGGVAGETQRPVRQRAGRGLANLSARAAALGGRLSTHTEGDRFQLTVWVPLPAASERLDGEDSLAAGNPAHRVDEVVGGTVLDQEP